MSLEDQDENDLLLLFGALVFRATNPSKSAFQCYEDSKWILGSVYEIMNERASKAKAADEALDEFKNKLN